MNIAHCVFHLVYEFNILQDIAHRLEECKKKCSYGAALLIANYDLSTVVGFGVETYMVTYDYHGLNLDLIRRFMWPSTYSNA